MYTTFREINSYVLIVNVMNLQSNLLNVDRLEFFLGEFGIVYMETIIVLQKRKPKTIQMGFAISTKW
jgi:hypothetical protein